MRYTEGRRALGDTVSLQLRIPIALRNALTDKAQDEGRSLNSEITKRLLESLGGALPHPSNGLLTEEVNAALERSAQDNLRTPAAEVAWRVMQSLKSEGRLQKPKVDR